MIKSNLVSQSHADWLELPLEIADQIFSYLDTLDLFHISRVCTYWNSLVQITGNTISLTFQSLLENSTVCIIDGQSLQKNKKNIRITTFQKLGNYRV